MTEPSPLTWTLRFKSHKTTVLLHVNPLQTFSSIKSQLYTALQDTSLRDYATGATVPLPSSPDDIRLGRPINVNDPHAGFVLGEWEVPSEDSGDDIKGKGKASAKGKGKARKSSSGEDGDLASDTNIKQCPKGAGLRDGAVLAFRWPGINTDEGDWVDVGGDVDMEQGERKKVDMWGVKIATFEDAYGVENEGDVGGGRSEFEG